MKLTHPSSPNITLESLLRRRKTTLARFLEASGVTTYELLVERCNRMGVTPPERRTFEHLIPPVTISSPMEGVVILETPETISEVGDVAEELPVLSDPYPVEKEVRRK